MKELIANEIKKNSSLGKECSMALDKKQNPHDAVLVSLLIRAVVSSSADKFLLDGYVPSLDGALYFECNFREMTKILNFQANDNTCIKRLKIKGGNKETDEEITARLDQYRQLTEPVIEFYRQYGIVRDINADMEPGQVYSNVKENLYPTIYSLIGKKYSGKSTISKIIAEKMGMKTIDFGEFLKSPHVSKKDLVKDNDFIVMEFIKKLRDEEGSRIIIEDFPRTKEQYSFFVNNCKQFQKILYLNADNSNCFDRMREIGMDHTNYIGCSELGKLLYEFEQRAPFINFLKKKNVLLEIDVNNHQPLIIQKLMSQIQPHLVLVKSASEVDTSTSLDILKTNYGYQAIDVMRILHDNIKRQTHLGKQITQYKSNLDQVPNNFCLEALKQFLFKDFRSKYILVNYPRKEEEIAEFEEKICRVNQLIYISLNTPMSLDSVDIYFKKSNRLSVIQEFNVNEYTVAQSLGLIKDVNIIYGMPLSGKKTLTKHLETKYNFRLIDIKEVINDCKKKKTPPEEDWEATELTTPELIKGVEELIAELPNNQRVLVTNIITELTEELPAIEKLIEALGKIRILYELHCEEIALMDRYKTKNEIEEELTEDQLAQYQETLEKPKAIMDMIKQNCYKVVSVNTTTSEFKTKMLYDYLNGRNLVIVKSDDLVNMDGCLNEFSGSHGALYVNVPQLIYRHFYLNDEWAVKLENSYSRKIFSDEVNGETKRDIFHKYNPIHFDSKIVNDLIIHYINENYREIEDNGNFVIITGVLNNDLLPGEESSFNLPLLETQQILDLGKETFLTFRSIYKLHSIYKRRHSFNRRRSSN